MELEQKLGLLKGRVNIRVTKEDVLEYHVKKLSNTSTHKFDLININPKYNIHKSFSLSSAIITILLIISSIVMLTIAFKEVYDDAINEMLVAIPIMFIFTSLFTLNKTIKSRVNVVNFFDHYGAGLFSIKANKPSKENVIDFCENLTKRIEDTSFSDKLSQTQMNTMLEKYVELLFDQNVLTEDEKQKALKRINEQSQSQTEIEQNEILH